MGVIEIKNPKEDNIINPFDNFNINISNLKEVIEIFPKIIKAFSIIYGFLIEELENNPKKEETLRKISYDIYKCINPSAKRFDSYDKKVKEITAKIGKGSSKGTLTWMDLIPFFTEVLESLFKDSGDPKKARKLIKQKISEGNEHNLILKLCYVHQITILEVYLRDTFVLALENDTDIFRCFIENYRRIKDRKFKSHEVYKIKTIIFDEYIENHVFHKIRKDTKEMYLAAFNINLHNYKRKNEILKIVQKRHDIVHRNSFDKKGKEFKVKKLDLEKSIKAIQGFVEYIENELREKGYNKHKG